jgi:GAF domain-containing protein
MTIVLLAALVLMNARLKQYLKEINIRLIQKFAPIVAHALMFARLKQFTPNNTGTFCF